MVVAVKGTRLRDTIIVLTFVLVCIMFIVHFRARTPLTVEREKPLGGAAAAIPLDDTYFTSLVVYLLFPSRHPHKYNIIIK